MDYYTSGWPVIFVLLLLHIKESVGEYCYYNNRESRQYCAYGCCEYEEENGCCPATYLGVRIAVGTVLGFLIVLAVIIFYCCRRKCKEESKHNLNRQTHNNIISPNTDQANEVQSDVNNPSVFSLSPPSLFGSHPANTSDPPPSYASVVAQQNQGPVMV
ncbi:hypothetical protein SNE40_017888 [Patella caerulea]|uniref:Uncharacterized protein n=1 Tax=Patella caerulea TaxID=87958 RepID=A0AAN8JBZ0_PATCE